MTGVTPVVAAIAVVIGAWVSPLTAQAPEMKESKPGLLAKAAVTADSAQRIALAKIPGGKVHEAMIDEVGGKLIYAFRLKSGMGPGYDHVHVDAMTGSVVRVKRDEIGDAGKASEKKPPQR